jgi:hypothetical protein
MNRNMGGSGASENSCRGPGRPALEVVDQLGERYDTDHLVSYLNLEVEVRGREVAKTFHLIQIRKLNP